MIKPKPVAKNVLFDPSALKSSNLFKKIAKTKESDSEEDEWGKEEKVEAKKEHKIEPKLPDPFSDFVPQVKQSDFVASKNEKSPDLFDSLPQQSQLINSAQKVSNILVLN